jgi:signal transduction histidine kinase
MVSFMKNEPNRIERFFLNTLLLICIVGNLLTLIADLITRPSDPLALPSDIVFSVTLATAFAIRNKYPSVAVLGLTSMALVTVLFQSFHEPSSTITSLCIILIVGFVISVMLKGWQMWLMHGLTLASVNTLFVFQFLTPALRFSIRENDTISLAITYTILYFILGYASAILKKLYDENNQSVVELYNELQMRNNEIVAQNEELMQIQDHLNELNMTLEKKVLERTAKIQSQNEILIKYSYANAHHLRGPVARLLGLANVYEIDPAKDVDFLVQKMREEAQSIDSVIKQINEDLNTSSEDFI